MTWFAVDDMFHGHPKLAELGTGKRFAEAIALWTMAGSWSALHLTDGRVSAAQICRLVPYQPTQAASDLIRVGLWEGVGDGFQFRDWADYQPTKEEVEAKRAGGAARTRKSRRRASVGNTVTDGATDVSDTRQTRPPVPSRPPLSKESVTHAPERGATPEPNQALAGIPADRFLASVSVAPGVPVNTIAQWFSKHRFDAGHGKWTWIRRGYGADFDVLTKIANALAGEAEPETAFADACRGFWADESAKAKGYPISFLAADVGRYAARGAATGGAAGDAAIRDVMRIREAIKAAVGGDPEVEARLQAEYLAAQKRLPVAV
jgi:hypothetical protein